MKRIKLIGAVVLCTALCAIQSFAASNSVSWLPTVTHHTASATTVNNQACVTTRSTFTFSSSQAIATNGSGGVLTFDHKIGGTVKGGEVTSSNGYDVDTTLQVTSLPGPYFDFDDDSEPKDGYYDEFEIAVTGQVVANKQYNMYSRFFNNNEWYQSNVDLWGSRSFEFPVGDRYNTIPGTSNPMGTSICYDNRFANSSQSVFSLESASEPLNIGMDSLPEQQVILYEKEATINTLAEKEANQKSEYVSTLKDTAEDFECTVTFAQPMTLSQMNAVLDTSGATLLNYQAVFRDNSEDLWYAQTSMLDEESVIDGVESCINDAGKELRSYEGIVSMNVMINSATNTYESLSQNPLVLIADISEALWLADHPEATDVDIIVPNYSNLVVE